MTSPSLTITKHSDKTIVKLQVEDAVSKLWANKAKRLRTSPSPAQSRQSLRRSVVPAATVKEKLDD